MSCEKCWADSCAEAHFRGGSQTEHYARLLEERKDHPCSPREQAGQFWDDEKQRDRREEAR